MKQLFFLLYLGLNFIVLDAQTTVEPKEKTVKIKPYNPKDNAGQKINALIIQAKAEHKNIILQAGGNWCKWCLLFNDFIHQNKAVAQIIETNYLYYHLNYSPENKNKAIFKKYDFPGDKYGYPVLIVLDSNGNLLHIQETGILEKGEGYEEEKVLAFLNQWKPTTL